MTTTVTAKGQVTIPKRLRDALGLKPGTKVDVEFSEEGALVKPARKRPGKSEYRKALESVRGTMDLGGMTTDEYMKWIRGED